MPGLSVSCGIGSGFTPLYLGASSSTRAADEGLLGHVLDAEVAHADRPVAAAALVGLLPLTAVVEDVALRGPHADVARPVELGADLADLGRDELVVEDEPVAAERAARRRARDDHVPDARPEGGDVPVVVLAERGGLALLDELDDLEDVLGRDPVDRAGLVVGAQLAGPPVLAERLVVCGFLRRRSAAEQCACDPERARKGESCGLRHHPTSLLSAPLLAAIFCATEVCRWVSGGSRRDYRVAAAQARDP